jgi:hypothetical protein
MKQGNYYGKCAPKKFADGGFVEAARSAVGAKSGPQKRVEAEMRARGEDEQGNKRPSSGRRVAITGEARKRNIDIMTSDEGMKPE